MKAIVTSKTETRTKVVHELELSSTELLGLYLTMADFMTVMQSSPELWTTQMPVVSAFLEGFTPEKQAKLEATITEEQSWRNT